MQQHNLGQLIYPTGGGKTLNMIMDAVRQFQSVTPQTVVVVAPRILLAEQLSAEFLEFITNAAVFHVHSGETHHESSTRPAVISQWVEDNQSRHKLIVTTYNSLQRLVDAEIDVDTIYFDEAHNSVKRNFFPATEHFSANANRCFFFTATRKTSVTVGKPGMNDVDVYGNIICRVSAPELVDGGYIVAPKIIAKKFEVLDGKQITAECDSSNLLETLNDIDCKKNPDSCELLRGKSARLQGNLHTLLTLTKGLPMTYNRDLQEDKLPVFDSYDQTALCVDVLAGTIGGLTVKVDACAAAVADPALLATDLADYLVERGVPFRKAHHAVGAIVQLAEKNSVQIDQLPTEEVVKINPAFGPDWIEVFDLKRAMAKRRGTGMPGPKQLRRQFTRWTQRLRKRT